jgi:mitochondrial import inner membrane translocase subunit TIM54
MGDSPPPRRGGIYSALRYTGIPPSWLEKRPKLPSRNWLIFLSAVTALTALYVDDRRKCRKIREEYAAKVRHLAEEPLGSMDWGRKVTVYSCRYPEDHDHERSMKYFKKYVKVSDSTNTLSNFLPSRTSRYSKDVSLLVHPNGVPKIF